MRVQGNGVKILREGLTQQTVSRSHAFGMILEGQMFLPELTK